MNSNAKLSLSLCLSLLSSLFFFFFFSSLLFSHPLTPSLPISLDFPSNLSPNLSSVWYSLLFHMTPVLAITFSIFFSHLFSPFSFPPSSPTFLLPFWPSLARYLALIPPLYLYLSLHHELFKPETFCILRIVHIFLRMNIALNNDVKVKKLIHTKCICA